MVNSMDSRMERYTETDENSISRTKRNANVYSSLDMNELSRIKTNNNVSVISEAPKQIDIEKIKKYICSMNSEEEDGRRKVMVDIPNEETENVPQQIEKDYDINSVLERARGTRETDYESERYRKLNQTQYEILSRINVDNKEEVDSDITGPIDELNTQEKTIIDLINDIAKTKTMKKEELFEDLMSKNDDTVVMGPIGDEVSATAIKEELDNITRELENLRKPLAEITQGLISDQNKLNQSLNESDAPSIEKIESDLSNTKKMGEIDKSFFTNSMSFSKNDFEGFDELEQTVKKNNFYARFAIFMIIIVLLATVAIIVNYVFDFGWL